MLKKIIEKSRQLNSINFLLNKIFFQKNLQTEKKVFLRLKELERLDNRALAKIQEKKLLDMFSCAYSNTIYYKKLFDDNTIDISKIGSLKKIPLLTKNIIKMNQNELLSSQYSFASLKQIFTGGTTGNPLSFYADKMAISIDIAYHWYLYSLIGYRSGDVIINTGGFFLSNRLRLKNIYWKKNPAGSVWGKYFFSVLYLNHSNVQFYLDKIIQIKPTILRGTPFFYDTLARYILENEIMLDFRIKGVILTSEMCSLVQRINIEKAFSTMVFFEYGHSELSVLSYTGDNTYIYKSFPMYGYVEVLKDNGKDADIGEVGNIIVTGFSNHGMPFIRYETGDTAEVIYKEGGIVHFKNINGRKQDYIISKKNQKISIIALLGQHFKAFEHISQWQLIQGEPGIVKAFIIKTKEFTQKDENDILDKFANILDIEAELNYVDEIPLTSSGKHLFLIQNIKEDADEQ